MKNQTRDQFKEYTDEKLIQILWDEGGTYSEEEKAAASELLSERGYDVAHEGASKQDTASQFDNVIPPDGLLRQEALAQESGLGLTGNINLLMDNIEQQEEKLKENWSSELGALSDEELTDKYAEFITPLRDKIRLKLKELGPIPEMELRTIIAEINSRSLTLPLHLVAIHKKVKYTLNEMTTKEAKGKQTFNTIFGAILVIFPILIALLGLYSTIQFICIVIGCERLYAGARAVSLAQKKML